MNQDPAAGSPDAEDDATDDRRREGEFATARAVEILDEIGLRLLEIRLVLDIVAEEVSMRLDDFYAPLEALERVAQDAVGAAGLLHAGAELAEPWGYLLSRPKAIFARHGAAVRAGAARVKPPPSSHSRFNGVLDLLSKPITPPGSTSRAQCPAMVGDGSRQCSHRTLYVGKNRFGTACYTHASEDERRLNQEFTAGRVPGADYEEIYLLCSTFGIATIETWLAQRPDPYSLHSLIDLLDPDGAT